MPPLFDYHTHTAHSVDARGSVKDLIGAARQAGISHLACTEHVDFVPSDTSCGFFRPEEYVADVLRARNGLSGIHVAMGMELGIEPEYLDKAHAVADLPVYRQLDFVIGSVHAVRDQLLGDGYYLRRTRKQAFCDYFASLLETIGALGKTGLVDVIGHLDLVKRYAPPGFSDGWFDEAEDMVREVLRATIDAGIGLEINVSGFRQTPNEQYPSLEVLRLYQNAGGEILTIGSDSHSPQMVLESRGRLAMGLEVARQAGFQYVTTFALRKPTFVRI